MAWMHGGQRTPAARLTQAGRIILGLGALVGAFQVSVFLTTSASPRPGPIRGDAGSAATSPASSASVASASGATSLAGDSTARRLFEALDELMSGPSAARQQTPVLPTPTPRVADAAELRRADEAVAQARADLQLAQAELTRARSSPDALELRLAEQELAAAETMVVRAESEVNRLSGPNPARVAASEREVLRAEATLRATMTLRAGVGEPGPDVGNDSAVQRAWLTLQNAVARHDQVRSGPPASEVAAAQDALSDAKARLQNALQRLERARNVWPSASIGESQTAVTAARAVLVEAEAHQRALWAGLP